MYIKSNGDTKMINAKTIVKAIKKGIINIKILLKDNSGILTNFKFFRKLFII